MIAKEGKLVNSFPTFYNKAPCFLAHPSSLLEGYFIGI